MSSWSGRVQTKSRYSATVDMWHKPAVWQAVADDLRSYRNDGLARLLTEDTVRFAAARALMNVGVPPRQLRAEWPHPVIKGSRVDLVVGETTPVAFIEFKYPREPNEKNAAWTMALGEVLKDLYRLAACPSDASRLFVYVETARLRRYMANAAHRYGLNIDVDEVALRPADAARLPTTAAQIIGTELATYHVTAQRKILIEIDQDLRLAVYTIGPLGAPPGIAARLAAENASNPGCAVPDGPEHYRTKPHAAGTPANVIPQPAPPPPPTGTRDGARPEILAAIHAVLIRSGGQTFTPTDIINEMTRRGTGYCESTIRTMITSHMCVSAPVNAGTTYDDIERVGRGLYRLANRERGPSTTRWPR